MKPDATPTWGFTSKWLHNYEARRTPQPEPSGNVTDESALQRDVLEYCAQQGWLVFSGSMAHRTFRTAGEPDLEIYADGGRHWIVELKTRTGKLSPEQLGVKAWLEKLGHNYHVVRSMEQFLELVKPK